MSFTLPSVFFLLSRIEFSFCATQEQSRITHNRNSPDIYFFKCGLNYFSYSSKILIADFLFHYILFVGTTSKMSNYFQPSFLLILLMISWLSNSIISLFPFLVTSMAHFSMSNSFPISWLKILFKCVQFLFITGKDFKIIHVYEMVPFSHNFINL